MASARPVGTIFGLGGPDAAGALYRYDDGVQRLILAAKNGGRRDLLVGFGAGMAPLALALLEGTGSVVVTWVPSSRAGSRRRGYDHGRLLARSLAAELRVPCRRLLVRQRGRPQTGRARADRLDGPVLRAAGRVPDRVLVVDDVITTGASLGAATVALRDAGARSVVAAAVAWNASLAEVAAGRPSGIGA